MATPADVERAARFNRNAARLAVALWVLVAIVIAWICVMVSDGCQLDTHPHPIAAGRQAGSGGVSGWRQAPRR